MTRPDRCPFCDAPWPMADIPQTVAGTVRLWCPVYGKRWTRPKVLTRTVARFKWQLAQIVKGNL